MRRSVLLILVLLILMILGLYVGGYFKDFNQFFKALTFNGSEIDSRVIYKIRIPRVIAAVCVGSTLATSGHFTRTALKNPLADSGILGVQTGATAFALIIIIVLPSLWYLLPIAAFTGGMLAFTLVTAISYSKSTVRSSDIVLAGVAVNAFFTAIIGIVSILYSRQIGNALNWLNGSLVSITEKQSVSLAIITVIMLIVAMLFKPILNILKLDDDNIVALGKNTNLYKLSVSVFAVFLASLSIVYVGIIGFIGIIAPQITKMILGKDNQSFLITNMLIGSILVLSADILQKVVFYPYEIPVGIIIGFVGAPLFLYLLKRGDYVKH